MGPGWRIALPFLVAAALIYLFDLGVLALGAAGGHPPAPPPDWDWSAQMDSIRALGDWALGLGAPLALGVFLLACLLAVSGYVIVRVLWNIHLRRAWIARRRRRRTA
jgi:hypothetical protein